MPNEIRLTPVELELMNIVWKMGQGTVRDVMELLPSHRNLAYTSVSTILRILEQKKILTTKKIGRQHLYVPLLSKENFATRSIKNMVKQVFSDNPVELVTYLVDKNKLSREEIKAIQKLLNDKKKEMV